MAAVGTFLTGSTISIGVRLPAGRTATGWRGATVAPCSRRVVCVAAAVWVLLDTRRLSPKMALIIGGFVTAVIAIAGILDTNAKADKVQDEFAIPAGRVAAEVGSGLWLVAAGGVLEVASGVAAPTPTTSGSTVARRRARTGA